MHNGFEVYIRESVFFSPCGYNIDHPYNQIVFLSKDHINWISNDDYAEDILFAVQLFRDFCNGTLCVATAVYDADCFCSPQIIVACKHLPQFSFSKMLSLFQLKTPSGDRIKRKDISKIKFSYWEKNKDFTLERQQEDDLTVDE